MSEQLERAKARAMAELYKAQALRKFDELVHKKSHEFRCESNREPVFLYLGDDEKAVWNILTERSFSDRLDSYGESDLTKKHPTRMYMGLRVLFVTADSHFNVA